MTDLNKVEATAIAVSRGIGSEWAKDHVQALALSSVYNDLGAALLHLDGHRNVANCMLVVNLVARDLVKLKICKESESVDMAQDAILWWLDKNCPHCKGAGVSFEQISCPKCRGTGNKPKTRDMHKPLAIMNASLEQLELQQRKRLSGIDLRAPASTYGSRLTKRKPMLDEENA